MGPVVWVGVGTSVVPLRATAMYRIPKTTIAATNTEIRKAFTFMPQFGLFGLSGSSCEIVITGLMPGV